jgi:putative endonuclease
LNLETGIAGEDFVASSLSLDGWEIIARNWRTRRGEIDIIGRERDTIVFIEVKTWPHGEAADLDLVIGPAKQKRMVETAKCFLDTHRQYNGMYVRFDVVLVNSGMYHLKDAFSERV